LQQIEKELADEENNQEVELDHLLAMATNSELEEGSDEDDESRYFGVASVFNDRAVKNTFFSNYDSELDDDVPSLNGGRSFSEEETKSKFTNYSMSSSVIRRNDQVRRSPLFQSHFPEVNCQYFFPS
jgi:hypothetical protein